MADHFLESPRKIDWALLGIVITLLLQGGSALWWASKMDTRLAQLENEAAPLKVAAETVARLDERTKATDASVQRIERKLDRYQ